jgi:hypothetical protein
LLALPDGKTAIAVQRYIHRAAQQQNKLGFKLELALEKESMERNLLLLVAICCSAFMTARGSIAMNLTCADTGTVCTSPVVVLNPPTFYENSAFAEGFADGNYVTGDLNYGGAVSGFSESVRCLAISCQYSWQGDFSGQFTLEVKVYSTTTFILLSDTQFTGTISGSFSGSFFQGCGACTDGGISYDSYEFAGQSLRGWLVSGSGSGDADSSGHFSESRLDLAITTPEPGSLFLLGAGLLGVLGRVRKQLRPS